MRERCVDAFGAFQACREAREARERELRAAALRNDILLGPLLRAWDRVTAAEEEGEATRTALTDDLAEITTALRKASAEIEAQRGSLERWLGRITEGRKP